MVKLNKKQFECYLEILDKSMKEGGYKKIFEGESEVDENSNTAHCVVYGGFTKKFPVFGSEEF